jgi:hypothetical protein
MLRNNSCGKKNGIAWMPLLTFTIKHYAEATELQELRQTLLDILLDSRYQLQEALQQDQTNKFRIDRVIVF